MQLKMGSKFHPKLNISQIKVFRRIAKKGKELTTTARVNVITLSLAQVAT